MFRLSVELRSDKKPYSIWIAGIFLISFPSIIHYKIVSSLTLSSTDHPPFCPGDTMSVVFILFTW